MSTAAAQHTTPARTLINLPMRVDPIVVRDPFLEFLGLVDPGEPIAVTFEDLVKAAGHLCPTVAGAYLIMRHGLAALYGNTPAVRGDVRVTAYGAPTDFGYGPISQLVNLVLGAAPETGFGGLGPRFRRRDLFVFRRDDVRHNEFDFERTETGQSVHVTYDPSTVPAPPELPATMGPAVTGTGSPETTSRFRTLWIGRVRDILAADGRAVHLSRNA